MKNIEISKIMDLSRKGLPVTALKLRDASRAISSATGELAVNTDVFFSSRVRNYYADDEIIEVGKKRLNLSEMQRQLSRFIGKGLVYFVQDGRAFEGELVE